MNILITGKNSYIANHLKTWIMQRNPSFFVHLCSLRQGMPTVALLSGVDVVIHCSALVHDHGKNKSWEEFYHTNVVQTMALAQNAKQAGVSAFIFLSTMAVYGLETGRIDQNTPCLPKTDYGKSKYLAEQKLESLAGTGFALSIVRPPMVYGADCPGNYKKLMWLATKTPIFPKVNNARSMIHIDNLCELIYLIVTSGKHGYYHPQDDTYHNTTDEVWNLAQKAQRKIQTPAWLGTVVTRIPSGVFEKMFGTLVYDFQLSKHFQNRYIVLKFGDNKGAGMN